MSRTPSMHGSQDGEVQKVATFQDDPEESSFQRPDNTLKGWYYSGALNNRVLMNFADEDDIKSKEATKKPSFIYKRSNDTYGSNPANVKYHQPPGFDKFGLTANFTDHLGYCGMYRNHGLNTNSTRSKVNPDPPQWHLC